MESFLEIARRLLESPVAGLEEVRAYEFDDDEEAHDDERQEQLETEFSNAFNELVASVTSEFGHPTRTGQEDDDLIPLAGVFEFAIWQFADRVLFAAATHEDRELPYLLVLGTTDSNSA